MGLPGQRGDVQGTRSTGARPDEERAGMHFFDCECSIGKLKIPQPGSFSTVPELVREMAYYGIQEALVYHSLAKEYAPALGNELLVEALRGVPNLHGCWVLQPHFTGEMPPPVTLVAAMAQNGIRAARLFPGSNGQQFSLSSWSCGPLFEVLAERRVPVFIDKDLIEWDQVLTICKCHTTLPVVLSEVWYKDNRYLYPLLEQLPNLYVSLSRFIGHQCLEDICRRYGSGHLLFGSKLPVFTPGPVMSMITYAEISDEEKAAIAANNLRRLLQGVA